MCCVICSAKHVGIGGKFLVGRWGSRWHVIQWHDWNGDIVIWMIISVNDGQRWSTWFESQSHRGRMKVTTGLRLIDNRTRASQDFLDDAVTVAWDRRVECPTIGPRQTATGSQTETTGVHPRRYIVAGITHGQSFDKVRKIVLCAKLHKLVTSWVSSFKCFVRFFVNVLRSIISKFNHLSA